MRATTTHNPITTHTAGFPPAPSEAHQRSVVRNGNIGIASCAEEVERPVVCLPTMRGCTLLRAVLLARIHQHINQLRGVNRSDIDGMNFENAAVAAFAQGYADYVAGIGVMPELFTWDALLVRGWKDGFAAAFARHADPVIAASTDGSRC